MMRDRERESGEYLFRGVPIEGTHRESQEKN